MTTQNLRIFTNPFLLIKFSSWKSCISKISIKSVTNYSGLCPASPILILMVLLIHRGIRPGWWDTICKKEQFHQNIIYLPNAVLVIHTFDRYSVIRIISFSSSIEPRNCKILGCLSSLRRVLSLLNRALHQDWISKTLVYTAFWKFQPNIRF